MQNANKIKVRDGQSLFDVALQQYGNVEAVFLLVEDNAAVASVDSTLYSQQILRVRKNDPLIKPATAESLSGSGGVGTIITGGDDNKKPGAYSGGFSRGYLIETK